jgi:carbonic anhydrase
MPYDVDPLLQGFRRFQSEYFGEDTPYRELAHGQQPGTLVIGCCDSRVHPPQLVGAAPGEVFVLRNVANLVPPYDPDSAHASVAASLEFAVLSLKVQRIVVLGHSGCGGIRALMQDDAPADSALARWLAIAAPARAFVVRHHAERDEAAQLTVCEKAAILVSIEHLLSYPWILEAVEAGRLRLDGWYFDMRDGALWGYDPKLRRFIPLVCPLEN